MINKLILDNIIKRTLEASFDHLDSMIYTSLHSDVKVDLRGNFNNYSTLSLSYQTNFILYIYPPSDNRCRINLNKKTFMLNNDRSEFIREIDPRESYRYEGQ